MEYVRLQDSEILLSGTELEDYDSRGKKRNWADKKMRNELLASAYDSIDTKKALRLRECSKILTYRVYADGTKQLDSMSSCRVRLCPICTWRRSLKIYGQTREIVDYIAEHNGYRWVMLTLTVKSCTAGELADTIDKILQGWNRLLQLKAVKTVCKGWYRSLEITHDMYPFITQEMWDGDPARHIKSRKGFYKMHGYNVGDPNPTYDTYHPHIHALICVNSSYFTSRDYIKHQSWVDAWAQSARLDYVPRVDIRSVKGESMNEIAGAVCEVAKYAAKDADYIQPDDWDLTVETVKTLDRALDGRRLVAYGGCMRSVKKLLKLDDVEDGDLVHVEGESLREDDYRLVSYWWYTGYRQYYEII